MPSDSAPETQFYTQVDIGADAAPGVAPVGELLAHEQIRLLRDLVSACDRQNELLQELLAQSTAQQRQRSRELSQWKKSNPWLAERCRDAAASLQSVQTSLVERIADEASETAEHLHDGEFMLQEFVDRFGPRMAHLNGLVQVLSQLAAQPTADEAEPASED